MARAFSHWRMHAQAAASSTPGAAASSRTVTAPRRRRSGGTATAPRATSSDVSTAPPSTSLWPPRYFVELCTTRSAPSSSGRCSTGLAKVLSTATSAPAPCTSSLTASRSTMRRSGLVGDSSQTRRVRSVIAAAIASGSVGSTAVKREPVAPEDLVEQPEGAAVDVLGEDDVVAGIEEQHHGGRRGQAGREREAVRRRLRATRGTPRGCRESGCRSASTRIPGAVPGDSCANVVAR